MKYTVILEATIEDPEVYTDEQLEGTAKEFLENLNDGKITIITEDDRIVKVEK